MLTNEDLSLSKDPIEWVTTFSLLSYAASFFLPVVDSGQRIFFGWQAFLISFHSLFDDGNLVWVANPAYWTALFFYFRGKMKTAFSVLSILAFALALTVIEMDELRIGYYVWLSSHFLLAAASVSELVQSYLHRVVS